MKKLIKYICIIICFTLMCGCGTKEETINNDELRDIYEDFKDYEKQGNGLVEVDDEGAAATCYTANEFIDSNGYIVASKFAIFTDENDIVTGINSQEIVYSNDPILLEEVEDGVIRNYEMINEQYGGYEFNIDKKDNKLTSNVTIDYTKTDLESMATDNETVKIYLNDNYQFTLDSIKKFYVSMGAQCK